MTDEDVRRLLREMRDEPVPADSLARVRLAVAELSGARTGIRRLALAWKFVGVLAATAIAVLVFVSLRPTRQSVSPVAKIQEAATTSQVSPPPIITPERKKTGAIHPPKWKQKPRRNPTANAGGVVVRIETTDPDVVILLIGD
jgi:hypothetical protein